MALKSTNAGQTNAIRTAILFAAAGPTGAYLLVHGHPMFGKVLLVGVYCVALATQLIVNLFA